MESSTKEQASHRSSIALAVPQQILIHAPLWERPCASMGRRQDYFKFQIHTSARKRRKRNVTEKSTTHFNPHFCAEATRRCLERSMINSFQSTLLRGSDVEVIACQFQMPEFQSTLLRGSDFCTSGPRQWKGISIHTSARKRQQDQPNSQTIFI